MAAYRSGCVARRRCRRPSSAAARHLPPLSPEIYKKLQYRNGAQPVNPTNMSLPAPRVRQMSLARVNGSPLMFVAGFLVVFLCGGIVLFSAARQLQPTVLTTAVANSTDQGEFGGPMGLTMTATTCRVGLGTNVPGCISATAPAVSTDSTWTPIPRGTSTPVLARPIATTTPRPPFVGTMTSSTGMTGQNDAFNSSLTQTMIAVYSTATVWPDYMCVATNTSGTVVAMYAQANDSQVVDYWGPGSSRPVNAAMYGLWVQVFYGKWVMTNGVTLTGPCNEVPQPTATIEYQSTATDQCTVTNTLQSPLALYASADLQTEIVGYFPMGATQWVITQTNTGWYELYDNGRLAWFRAEGLTFQGNCSFVPLVTPTATPTQTWTPGPTSVPLQTIFSVPMRAITTINTVFYTVPDTGSAVLQSVSSQSEWQAVGIAIMSGTEWVSIITWEGKQAWIARSLVNLVDPSIPTPTHTPETPSGS